MARVTNTHRISQIKLKLMFRPLGLREPHFENQSHFLLFLASVAAAALFQATNSDVVE